MLPTFGEFLLLLLTTSSSNSLEHHNLGSTFLATLVIKVMGTQTSLLLGFGLNTIARSSHPQNPQDTLYLEVCE